LYCPTPWCTDVTCYVTSRTLYNYKLDWLAFGQTSKTFRFDCTLKVKRFAQKISRSTLLLFTLNVFKGIETCRKGWFTLSKFLWSQEEFCIGKF
jgi:hypothetical protein